MTSNEVDVVLIAKDGRRLELSPSQRDQLLQRYPDLEREAAKWRAVTGRRGCLCVIDEAIVSWGLNRFSAEPQD